VDEQRLNAIIIGKLGVEGLSIQSPWEEIETCLSRTVRPDLCISVARRLKAEDEGKLL